MHTSKSLQTARFVATAGLQVNTVGWYCTKSIDIVSKVFTHDVNEISLDKKQCSVVVSLLSLNRRGLIFMPCRTKDSEVPHFCKVFQV